MQTNLSYQKAGKGLRDRRVALKRDSLGADVYTFPVLIVVVLQKGYTVIVVLLQLGKSKLTKLYTYVQLTACQLCLNNLLVKRATNMKKYLQKNFSCITT